MSFVITGNTIGDGASVLLVNSSDTTVSGSTFSRNTVTQFGGAMAVNGGTLVVQDSTCVMVSEMRCNLVPMLYMNHQRWC